MNSSQEEPKNDTQASPGPNDLDTGAGAQAGQPPSEEAAPSPKDDPQALAETADEAEAGDETEVVTISEADSSESGQGTDGADAPTPSPRPVSAPAPTPAPTPAASPDVATDLASLEDGSSDSVANDETVPAPLASLPSPLVDDSDSRSEPDDAAAALPDPQPSADQAAEESIAAAIDRSDSSLKPMEGPVGRIAVGTAFGLLLLSVVLSWPIWLQQILLSGFIGGFTNTVAIHMLFTRVWYLPGSGVMLKRKDAIILTLADTMQEHILNPSLIEERVRALSRNVNPDRVLEGVNALISELRSDAIEFVNAPEQRDMITEAVRKEGGFWGDMADAVGVVTYDKVADRIVGGLVKQLEAFRVDRKMLEAATDYAGSFEAFLLEPGNPLIRRHYDSERSVAQILFEKLDARQLVIDKLSSYEAEQIRDIISENIKDHLAWLEVFGVILGMIISAFVLSIGALF